MTLDQVGEANAPVCASNFDDDNRVGIVTSGG